MKGILNGTRAIIRLTDNVGTTNQATLMGPHSHHKGPIGIIGALKILALPKRGGWVGPLPRFFWWILHIVQGPT